MRLLFALLALLLICGEIETAIWAEQVAAERERLKAELAENKAAFRMMFGATALEKKQAEKERLAYIAKWKQRNPDMVAIIETEWRSQK